MARDKNHARNLNIQQFEKAYKDVQDRLGINIQPRHVDIGGNPMPVLSSRFSRWDTTDGHRMFSLSFKHPFEGNASQSTTIWAQTDPKASGPDVYNVYSTMDTNWFGNSSDDVVNVHRTMLQHAFTPEGFRELHEKIREHGENSLRKLRESNVNRPLTVVDPKDRGIFGGNFSRDKTKYMWGKFDEYGRFTPED